MKQLSTIEIALLEKEMQSIIGSKVQKIYNPRDSLIIELHHAKLKKVLLKVILPGLIMLSKHKGATPENPSGLAMYLRKRLTNTKLAAVRQIASERIMEFEFQTKEKPLHLIIELFSQGNIILLDSDKTILTATTYKEWKDRAIKPKQEYKLPPQQPDIKSLGMKELSTLINSSSKDTLVKFLAADLGLGSLYAEELCAEEGLDKNKPLSKTTTDEKNTIIQGIQGLLNRKIKALKTENDITPYMLHCYIDEKTTEYNSFSEALDTIKIIEEKKQEKKPKLSISEAQQQRLAELEQEAKDSTKKAELIYENYQEIQAILNYITQSKKKDWKEMKKELMKNKLIKKVDERNGTIVLEL